MRRLLIMLILIAPLARGQESGTIRFFGSNELLVERYDVDGNAAFSPFRFEDTFFTNRLNLNLDWEQSDARNLTVRADVRGANNDYLAGEGVVLERFSADYENGALAVPLRISFGDVYAEFSRRMLSRNVRGASIEFQPTLGSADQSIVIVAGNGEPAWRDTFNGSGSDLRLNGVSYLASTRSGRARIVANFVDAQQRPLVSGAVPIPQAFTRKQRIGGLFGEFRLPRDIVAEGEINVLSGEGEVVGAAPAQRDTDGTSFYVQLARPQATVFDWTLRFEQNGQEFLPIGGVGIIANRRTGEARGGARLGGRRGMVFGRAQYIVDGFEGNVSERRTGMAGVSWESNPLAVRPLFFVRASADVQDIETDNRTLDLRFQTYVLDLADRWGLLDGRYRVSWRVEDNDVQPSLSRRLMDHNFTIGRSFTGSRLMGNVRGGLIYIAQSRSGDYDSWSPRIDALLERGRHSVLLHLGFVEQHFDAASIEDLHYDTRQLVYSYTLGRQSISFEWGEERRDPERSQETDSQRFALRYRLTFDHTS